MARESKLAWPACFVAELPPVWRAFGEGFHRTMKRLQTEHFACYSGQIILVTKLKRRRDLGFTQLPGQTSKPARAKGLSAILGCALL
jgi:hypothetical protein